MTSPTAAEPLIFPVGHYMGAFHPAQGATVKYHRVRLGDRSMRLESADEAAIWALAHGVPEVVGEATWTRRRLVRLAAEGGMSTAPRLVEELLADGLLAEVPLTGPEAVRFAQRHQLQPLMIGIGNSVDNPLRFRLGFAGVPTMEVGRTLYEFWQWGHLFDLWQACGVFADVAREGLADDPDEADPARILTRLLSSLHVLLSQNAAYLDEVEVGD